jgi:hypothetical protein
MLGTLTPPLPPDVQASPAYAALSGPARLPLLHEIKAALAAQGGLVAAFTSNGLRAATGICLLGSAIIGTRWCLASVVSCCASHSINGWRRLPLTMQRPGSNVVRS